VPPLLVGGLPSDLARRLASTAREIVLDEEGLEFQVMGRRTLPFWALEGEYPNRVETDPVRLQGVLEDVCELTRLAGGAVVQARPLSDFERRVADLERRIADRKGTRR
jgi:hypothetical protein